MRFLCLAAALLVTAGCAYDGLGPAPLPPEVEVSTVAPNPHNVLSAVVTARVRLADSVAVHFGLAGETLASASPAVVPVEDSVVVPVLGLLAETSYALQVVVYGAGQAVAGDTLRFSTGPLPDDLPVYVAGGPDPAPGYVVLAAASYALVIDNTGRVVWYRHFPDGPGLNFQPQPTGRYLARPPPADTTQPAVWVELDPLGNVTRARVCGRPPAALPRPAR